MASTPRIIRARPDQPPRRRPAPAATRVLRSSQVAALTEAERILGDATRRADAIVAEAERAAEGIRQQAVEAGEARAAALLVAAQERARQTVDRASDQLTRLAVAIAEKLLDEALGLQPQRVERIVARCLQQAASQGSRRITLRVHPDALPLVHQRLPWLQGLVDAEMFQVEPDPTISAGGCVIDTELGQVDGRLESQLEAIRRALETEP